MNKYLFILILCLMSSCKSSRLSVSQSDYSEPTYIINGIIFENNEKSEDLLYALKPNYIEKITILKDKEVQKCYPHLKKRGAIVIDLKSKETILKEENIEKLNKLISPQNLKIEDLRFYINGKEVEKKKVLQTHIGELSLKTGEDGKSEVYIKPAIYIR